jgi:Flp pilus assembly protein TadD
MARIASDLGRAGTCWALVTLGAALGGCLSGAVTQPKDPVEQKAEKIKQLPAEIMKAGDEAARGGDLQRAASLYTRAIEIAPNSELWHRVGYVYDQLDKKPLAMQAYANALRFDENNAAAREDLGLLLLEGKRRDQAKVQLTRAVELDPKRWRAHNALGVLADGTGDYASAIAHYDAALAANPNSPMLLNNLGYSNYLAGNLDRAAELYTRALALSPDYLPAKANVALLHARRRDYAQALELMLKIAEPPRAHNDVGFVALQNGDLDTAEGLLNEAIRLSPSYYKTAHENLQRVKDARGTRPAAQADAAKPAG